MTSYLPHYTKKRQILARREAAFQRLLASAAPTEKLVAAAETVRDARVRVLQVQRSLIVPEGEYAQYAKIDGEIERASNTSATSILAEFGHVLDPE